jgi:hypothetical protein
MKAILIFFLCLIKVMSNLILGGDFHYYRLLLIYYTRSYIMIGVSFNSSDSCGWSNPLNQGVKIINHTRVLTTYCANLRDYKWIQLIW